MESNTSQQMALATVQDKLAYIGTELTKAVPNVKTALVDIHRHIKADPDLAVILTEEEVGMLVKGLKHQTNTTIVTAAAKKPTKKALSQLSAADI